MKRTTSPPFLKKRPGIFAPAMLLSFAFIFTAFSISALAQGSQLSLADILIALRSKKATLPERNQILADAIITRGTTFTLTPEIEKELAGTGADKALLDSIRQKSQIIKIAAVTPPAETKPKVEPEAQPAPDFSFYEKRADASFAKGDFDAALGDYTKAIEMNATDVNALVGRAAAYFNKGSYTLTIADYSKAIELAPQNAAILARRGEAYEKKGNNDLALADYKKALNIEPANETAKANAGRLEAEQAKAAEKSVPVPTVTATQTPKLPEFVELGQLTESMTVKMAKPIYSLIALKSNIGGRVVVEVELDAAGNVTSAKQTSGHTFLKASSEEAARQSKFKPAMVGDQAVKAKGYIIYNFVPPR